MISVLNTRNNKKGKAEKINEDTYTIIFEDGDQKEISNSTFERWYQVLLESDLEAAPDASETPEADVYFAEDAQGASADAPEASEDEQADEASTPADEAPESVPEASEDAVTPSVTNADAEKAAEEAKVAKEAEKAAAAVAKKAEKEAKAAEKIAAKEAEAAKKAEAAKLKKVEADAKKATKEAAKASATPRESNMKQVHKEFFTKFLVALNAKESSVTKANARERNYLSFPAGASGFKFKFVKTGNKLDCSLYIFGPAVVTSALFKELEKYKEEIETQTDLSYYKLDWSAPEDMKVRRVRTVIAGTDEELIDLGVEILIRFRNVLIPYVDKITA